MRRTSMTAILGTVAFGALLGGCATTVEMGPGYYHYDSRAASTPSVVYREPTVVYREPTVVYREPGVVYRDSYRDSAVIYSEQAPAVLYRRSRPFDDHGS